MKAYLLLLALIALAGCQRGSSAPSKPAPPAKTTHAASESELNTIELTPEAEERLGIKTADIERRAVRRRRTYGGEVVLPTGASITVSAPVNGTLKAVSEGSVPEAGTHVKRNEPLFLLAPLLSKERDVLTPAERVATAQARLQLSQLEVDAQGQLQQAETQFEAAKINFDRAERLFKAGAGTAAVLDTATAQLELAEKALAAAQQRVALFEKSLESEASDATPIPIVSPREGYVRLQHATIGEIVPAGAPLFEVMDYDPIWIKVPVYVGEVASIADHEPARVWHFGDDPSKARPAEPVPAPPTADAQAATVDLYYRLANSDARLRPGQRLNVGLTLRSEDECLVVPWSAVVHDIYGGAWVYTKASDHRYVRQRVEVPFVIDDLAVLRIGPAVGTPVAIEGVAELFGTEFGAGH